MRSIPAAFFLAAALCGCDTTTPRADYSSLDLVDVTGTVTLDGAPLADAVITFDEPDGRSFSFARTDADGGYEMRFDSDVNGVTPGLKRVQISTTRSIVGLEPPGGSETDGVGEAEADAEDAAAAENASRRRRRASAEAGEDESFGSDTTERVPARYRGEDSELTAEVSADNDTFDFALTSG